LVEKVDQPENDLLGSVVPLAEGSASLNEPRLAVNDCVVSPVKPDCWANAYLTLNL
jgi:hypothetical protein